MSAVSASRRRYAGKIAKIKGKEGKATIFKGVGKELGDLTRLAGQVAAPSVKKWKDVQAGAKTAGAEVDMPGKFSFDWLKDPSKVLGDEGIIGQTGYDIGKGVTKSFSAEDLESIGGLQTSKSPIVQAFAKGKEGKKLIDEIGTKLSGSANVDGMTRNYAEKRLREMPISRNPKTGKKMDWTVDAAADVKHSFKDGKNILGNEPKSGVLKSEYGQYKSKFDLSMSPDTRDNYEKAFGGNIKMPSIPEGGEHNILEKYVPPSMPSGETSVIDDPSFNDKSLADRTDALNKSSNSNINDAGGNFVHKWNQTDIDFHGEEKFNPTSQSMYGVQSAFGSRYN